MNRGYSVAILAAALVATTALATSCGGGLPGNAVAKVGEINISNEEFTQQLENYAAQNGITKEADPENYEKAADAVLESLIWSQVAVQKAPTLGITVADREIQAEIDSMVNDSYGGDSTAFQSALASNGMTLDSLGERVGEFLLTGKVRDEVVKNAGSVTDEDVEAYYEDNKAQYLTELTVDARHILVTVGDRVIREDSTTTTTAGSTATSQSATTTSESTTTTEFSDLAWSRALVAAAQVRLELLAGGEWARLAKQYSDDKPTKNSGGALGTVSQGDLADVFGSDFDDVLFLLELDQISELVQTDIGYHIIQVTKITEPRQKTLDEAKDEIRVTLIDDAQWAAWVQWIEDGMLELGVTYRDDMRPTTTQPPTTAAPAASSDTTAKP